MGKYNTYNKETALQVSFMHPLSVFVQNTYSQKEPAVQDSFTSWNVDVLMKWRYTRT